MRDADESGGSDTSGVREGGGLEAELGVGAFL